MSLVHIADGDQLGIGLAPETAHLARPLAAQAHTAHHNTIAGRRSSSTPQRRCRDDMEQADPGPHACRAFQKTAAVYPSVFRHCPASSKSHFQWSEAFVARLFTA